MASGLTDSELRNELIRLGEKAVGPILDTTRKQYMKKLDRLYAAGKSSNKTRTSGTGTSRGRLGASVTGKSESSSRSNVRSRTSVAGRKTRQVKTGEDSDEENDEDDDITTNSQTSDSSRVSNSRRYPKTRSTRRARQEEERDDEEEDDDEENIDNNVMSALSRPSIRQRGHTPLTLTQRHRNNHKVRGGTPDYRSNIRPNSGLGRENNQSPLDWRSKRGSDVYYHDNRYNTSGLSNSVNYGTRNTNRDHVGQDEFSDSDLNDGSTVDVVSRSINTSSFLDKSGPLDGPLNQSRSRRSFGQRDGIWTKESTGRRPRTGADGNLTEEESILQHGFKTRDDVTKYRWSQFVIWLLPVAAVLFFLTLVLMYSSIRGLLPFAFTATDENSGLLCSETSDDQLCKNKMTFADTLNMIGGLTDKLAAVAGEYECSRLKEENGRKMPHGAVTKYLKENYPRTLESAGGVEKVMEMIAKHKELKIRMYDSNNSLSENHKDVLWLESEVATMGFLCRLMRSIKKVIFVIFLLIVVILIGFLMLKLIQYRIRKKEEETRRVYDLVESIIDVLKSHSDRCVADPSMEPFIAIPHVRDMLIPIKERKRMQSLWDRAVHFLMANDSRISIETQTIQGEDFDVWRWIQPSCANGNKVWQGQAFGENRDSSFNILPFTPTTCLKIRNMFDQDVECGEEWPIRIQDAILEKCGNNHQIVHIAVDKNSKEGCVYVKCANPDAAGRAYKALHGWWFDGNLVTVKFLRLERYHERFPSASLAIRPMRPSNDERRSLAQPYHRSVMELN